VIIWDHIPGTRPDSPNRSIQTPALRMEEAIINIYNQGSDIVAYPGHAWNVPESNAMADTTFVTASGDRRWVAFGEMPAQAAGRLIMWSAADSALSRVEDIQDVLNNTSDRIGGLELNADGSLGVARGELGTYFFGRDLRLQGLTAAHPARGRGAAFLPGSTGDRTLAFEPTLQGTVRILETTHYRVIREIPVREAITGPFRVGPVRAGSIPCPADPAVGAEGCVVATVYGVTAGRRLLVLEIRREDLVQ
jgi:hypothetical protein